MATHALVSETTIEPYKQLVGKDAGYAVMTPVDGTKTMNRSAVMYVDDATTYIRRLQQSQGDVPQQQRHCW